MKLARVSAHRARLGGPALAALLALAAAALPARAQHHPDTREGADSGVFPLYKAGLGDLTRKITTTDPTAQAYFTQGLQLMYAFATGDGLKSFQEASREDPACAMCAWGEAWAWGPYLNGPMRAEDEPSAHEAAARALRLAADPGAATPVERALIEAMQVRYAATAHEAEEGRRDIRSQPTSTSVSVRSEPWATEALEVPLRTLRPHAPVSSAVNARPREVPPR